MNVLSLFDGMSCGRIALERLGIKVDNYYASEIDKYAMKVSEANYPDIIQVGDITELDLSTLPKIDLVMGGSPCQGFSFAGKQLAFDDPRSALFFEFVRCVKELQPKYFLLENVRMKKKSEKQLNEYLGVEGLHINSELVSYQKRPRIYWTNIPNVKVPEDRNINFQDYKDTNFEYCKQFKVNKTPSRIKMWNEGKGFVGLGTCNNVTHSKKVNCLTRKQDRSPNSGLIEFDGFCRFLTRKELEQAQCVPVGYTNMVSYNQAQDLLGDGWTIDVISHLLKNIGEKI